MLQILTLHQWVCSVSMATLIISALTIIFLVSWMFHLWKYIFFIVILSMLQLLQQQHCILSILSHCHKLQDHAWRRCRSTTMKSHFNLQHNVALQINWTFKGETCRKECFVKLLSISIFNESNYKRTKKARRMVLMLTFNLANKIIDFVLLSANS